MYAKSAIQRGCATIAETAEEKIIKNLESIEKWASIGLSQKEIAERLDIGYSTFRKIKSKNIALLALFPQSAIHDRSASNEKVKKVERSLYERAVGYDYDTIEYYKIKSSGYDDKGKKWEKEELVEKTKKIHVPADVQAAKFYLINRDRRNWKDNPHKVENDKEMLQIRKKEVEARER